MTGPSSSAGVTRGVLARLAGAGLLTALSDGLFSSILSVAFYHSTVTRLWQGVASVLLGRAALEGGTPTALIGLAMHVGVAFTWSTVFLVLVRPLPWVGRLLATRWGTVKVASLYGPLIWMVMSLAVIPLFTHRAPAIGLRWWIQWLGHIPFVAVPIVASLARPGVRAEA